MTLGKSLTLPEISAELRNKAARLSQEMDQIYDPVVEKMRGIAPMMLLAVAMLDAVNDELEGQWRHSPDKQRRAMYERAVALCRERHPHTAYEPERLITGVYGQKAVIATVPKRRLQATDAPATEEVVAIGMNFVGMVPLWTHYLMEARLHFDAEGWPEEKDPG